MPSYNNGLQLEKSIESVKAQTHKNWELFVIDDNSHDAQTLKVLEKYANDPYIKVYKRETTFISPTQARNIGTRAAQGDYIAYIDDETIAHPDHLELAVKAF